MFQSLPRVFFVCAFLFVGWVSLQAAPNIILILTDDHGWSQMSELMDPEINESKSDYLETPNLTRMIHEGRRFTSGYGFEYQCSRLLEAFLQRED